MNQLIELERVLLYSLGGISLLGCYSVFIFNKKPNPIASCLSYGHMKRNADHRTLRANRIVLASLKGCLQMRKQITNVCIKHLKNFFYPSRFFFFSSFLQCPLLPIPQKPIPKTPTLKLWKAPSHPLLPYCLHLLVCPFSDSETWGFFSLFVSFLFFGVFLFVFLFQQELIIFSSSTLFFFPHCASSEQYNFKSQAGREGVIFFFLWPGGQKSCEYSYANNIPLL